VNVRLSSARRTSPPSTAAALRRPRHSLDQYGYPSCLPLTQTPCVMVPPLIPGTNRQPALTINAFGRSLAPSPGNGPWPRADETSPRLYASRNRGFSDRKTYPGWSPVRRLFQARRISHRRADSLFAGEEPPILHGGIAMPMFRRWPRRYTATRVPPWPGAVSITRQAISRPVQSILYQNSGR